MDFFIYILFNITYNHVSIVAWSMIPTIRNCQGSNPNDGGLCLEVNFNDGGPNEKAFLNRMDNCVHSGSFEKLDVAIAATSEECPIEETSTMQVDLRSFKRMKIMDIPGFSIFIKFMFSKKATKNDEIFTVDLTLTTYCQIDGEDFFQFLWPS